MGDLGGDLAGLELVADFVEGWGAVSALEVVAVAVGAAAVAEENGASGFVLFGGSVGGDGEESEGEKCWEFHWIFSHSGLVWFG